MISIEIIILTVSIPVALTVMSKMCDARSAEKCNFNDNLVFRFIKKL